MSVDFNIEEECSLCCNLTNFMHAGQKHTKYGNDRRLRQIGSSCQPLISAELFKSCDPVLFLAKYKSSSSLPVIFICSCQVLSIKSLKKQMKKVKNMTVKDIVTTLVSFYWSVFLGLLHVAFSVTRGFCRIFSNTFMGGNLVEGAKTIKVTRHSSIRTGSMYLQANQVPYAPKLFPTPGVRAVGQHA